MNSRSSGTGPAPESQAAVLFYGGVFILVNIMVDVAYGWIDPRVRDA